MHTDADLLRDFAAGSQEAFSALVHRHMDLVYASARRQVRDPHVAEDVAQAVFIILVREAGSLRTTPSIAGWLIKTTCHVASNARRAQFRRQKHEQVAAMLASQRTELPADDHHGITAVLDDAVSKLRPNDRSAIAMRFLQNRSVEEISATMQISIPAAAKRIERALSRLRSHLSRRGVVTSSIALAAALAAESSVAAPVSLSSAASASTFTPVASSLAKGTLTIMLRTKLVTAAAAFAVIVTGTGLSTHFLKAQTSAAAAAPAVAPVAVKSPTTAAADDWKLRCNPGDYGMRIDNTTVHNNESAALLESLVPQPQDSGMRHRGISAEPLRGKRMTLSADLKLQDISDVAGLLVIVVDEHDQVVINGDYSDKHLLGTVPWAHYTFTFVVPPTAKYVVYGMNVRGTGKLWATNFKLEKAADGTPVDDDTAWHIWSYTPTGFTWGKDDKVQRNGHATWFIDATQAAHGQWAYFDSNQRGIHETLAGKRMRYSVWIKCQDVVPPTGITFRMLGPDLSISPRYGRPGLVGTQEWTKCEMVIDVKDRATSICPGVKIQASGKIWIDEPKIEVVDKSVPLTK